MYILNIAAGNMFPIDPLVRGDILVNLDLNYFSPTDVRTVEIIHQTRESFIDSSKGKVYYVNNDVYDFLERYTEKFDKVVIYRFLEHVPKTKVLYFLYILSNVMKIGATMDVIVPDYEKLARRILSEDVNSPVFESEDIITTFELLNEPYCPHASIWTYDRIKHFIPLEERYLINDIEQDYKFDGRDIYIRFQATRIK